MYFLDTCVFGTQTAAVSATGQRGGSSGSGHIPGTQEYDGTTWSVGGNVVHPRKTHGLGSQSQGMIIGGESSTSGNTNTNLVEIYNKSIAPVILN